MSGNSIRYSSFAIGLHWLIALMLFGMLGLGFYMTGLSISPAKLRYFSYHKWVGVTVFLMALIRLAWRFMNPPPPLPAHMSALLRLAAHGGHLMLYGLMFCIPLSGWLMSSAKGFQTVWFGVLPLPDLLGRDPVLGKQLTTVHLALNVVLIVAVVGHALAALFHQFVHKDGTLYRMLPLMRLQPKVASD
ncbi:MAG: cytochrome b [Lautropia sp.]|nr:cytochrome b [Lautropia sp.]